MKGNLSPIFFRGKLELSFGGLYPIIEVVRLSKDGAETIVVPLRNRIVLVIVTSGTPQGEPEH